MCIGCGAKHAVYGPVGAAHGAKRQWCSGCARQHGARPSRAARAPRLDEVQGAALLENRERILLGSWTRA